MTRYHVLADGRYHSDHAGLLGACADARTCAQRLGFVVFRVDRMEDGEAVAVASYQLVNGKLEAWMR